MKWLKYFKQLFCSHRWTEYYEYEEEENVGGMLSIGKKVRYRRCVDCGKTERC